MNIEKKKKHLQFIYKLYTLLMFWTMKWKISLLFSKCSIEIEEVYN